MTNVIYSIAISVYEVPKEVEEVPMGWSTFLPECSPSAHP